MRTIKTLKTTILSLFITTLLITSPTDSKAYFVVHTSYHSIGDCDYEVRTVAEYDDVTHELLGLQVQFSDNCGGCLTFQASPIEPDGGVYSENFNISPKDCSGNSIEMPPAVVNEMWDTYVAPNL